LNPGEDIYALFKAIIRYFIKRKLNSKITCIDLSNNKLGNRGMLNFGYYISYNNYVIEIDLSENELIGEFLQKGFKNKYMNCNKLESLNVSKNQLGDVTSMKAIIDILRTIKTLKILNLSNNEISAKAIKVLSELFDDSKSNINLNILDLSNNNLGDDGVKIFSNMLIDNKDKILSIQALLLINNNIYCQGAFAISTMIQENLLIEVLSLSDNNIKSEGLNSIFKALTINKIMKSINLSRNLFERNKSYFFVESLSKLYLTELLLSGIKSYEYEDYLNLFHGLSKNFTIQSLDLSDNRFCNGINELFINELTNKSSIYLKLNLSGDFLWNNSSNIISNLIHLKSLQEFICNNNYLYKLNEQGLSSLKSLINLNSLIKLDLSSNDIGLIPFKEYLSLVECIGKNKSLIFLNLSDNDINNTNSKFLFHSLINNTNIKELLLNNNKINGIQLKEVTELIKKNACIERLSLCFNEITDNDLVYINNIKIDSKIKYIDFSGNNFNISSIMKFNLIISSFSDDFKLKITNQFFKTNSIYVLDKSLKINKKLII